MMVNLVEAQAFYRIQADNYANVYGTGLPFANVTAWANWTKSWAKYHKLIEGR